MSQSENTKKNYSEPELKAHGKISGLTQQVGGSGGFSTTTGGGFITTNGDF
ncbi:hypothetical protein [Nostoc sp. CCY0012]|uniref:hypothetical protein n=1 Tax=Nostoc sp. CCY0012 TaxID=1056123 RepID=UPI0039C5B922